MHPWTMLEGDAIGHLAGLPAGSFHAACTSPPYWKLRSYLKPDDARKRLELGNEALPVRAADEPSLFPEEEP